MALHFDTTESVAGWTAIDDRVMGGVSHSRLRFDAGGFAVFEGLVSADHGGGFASIRHNALALGGPGVTCYRLLVLGDGKRYKFNLRHDTAWDGVNYQAVFQAPADQWAEIDLPVAAFEPRWRGRLVNTAPAFDPSQVRQTGLMVGDGQTDPFRLALRSIRCL